MIAHTRNNDLERLVDYVRSLGANAVLGMRFDLDRVEVAVRGRTMKEATAYGSVVVVEVWGWIMGCLTHKGVANA